MNYYNLHSSDNDPLHPLSTRIGNAASPFIQNNIKRLQHTHLLALSLQHNLTKLQAAILYAAKWDDPKLIDLEAAIEKYNTLHKTTFSAQDFFTKGWVRLVNRRLLFPSVVTSVLNRISIYQHEANKEELPDINNPIWVLKLIKDRFPEEKRQPIISRSELLNLIEKHGDKEITISFLESLDIIVMSGENYQVTIRNDFQACFFSELAFLLWDYFGEHATATDFSKYLSILHQFDIFSFHDLSTFLDGKNMNHLCKLAVDFLCNESDLGDRFNEMNKVYLDQNHFQNFSLTIPVPPAITLDAEEPYLLLKQKQEIATYNHDLFDFQGARTIYRLALRMVIELQTNIQEPYADVVKLMKQCDRPFLVYELQYEIQRNYPYIIPYLLNDDQLAPIAMNMLDELKHSHQWIGKGLHIKDVANFRTADIEAFWQEGFSHLLNRYSKRLSLDIETAAHTIGRILLDQTQRVFVPYNTQSDYNRTVHIIQKKRYNQTLEQLRCRRLDSSGYHTSGGYVPLLIDNLLPSLLNVLKLNANSAQQNEFLKFESVYIFLYSDILRLLNSIDTSNDECILAPNELADLKKGGYLLLVNVVTQYFVQKTVKVSRYFESTHEMPVKRGVNDFGLELINWGELFLHFQSLGVLIKLDRDFKKSLRYDTRIKNYQEANNEELVKLDYYMRILLHAYIDISKNANRYSYNRLPVNETTDWLEERITYYATKYHSKQRTKWSIDLFNERLKQVTYNFYRRPIFHLLCQAVSRFVPEKQQGFIESFFDRSNNLLLMVTAHNRIDNINVQQWLMQKISGIDIKVIMKEEWTIAEIEQALLESIQSNEFFDFADPLLIRVEEYIRMVKQFSPINENFIFRLRAYQAFRKKDMNMLEALIGPTSNYVDRENHNSAVNVKKFYRALNDLYHEGDYVAAIDALGSLHSQFPKHVEYAFHLYRAKIYKAITHESE